MELRQLEMFLALAEELHFTRAAAQVNCAQSNVTTRIRALEAELGVQLFDRLAKRVILTDAGKRIRPLVERALSTIGDIREVVGQDRAPAGGLLIGASESMLTYRLPRVLATFRKKFPNVDLSFLPHTHDGLLDSTRSGSLDVAISMVDSIESDRLHKLRLCDERLIFIVGPKDPLATRKRIGAKDLAGQPFLVTETGCAYRKQLFQSLARLSVSPAKIIEFSSVEAIKQCVSLGLGVALLPQVVVAEGLARKLLKPLRWANEDTRIATYVVWNKDKWVSPALRAFIDVVQAELSGVSA